MIFVKGWRLLTPNAPKDVPDPAARRQTVDALVARHFDRLRCKADTKAGTRCRNRAVAGGLCTTHCQTPEDRRLNEGLVRRLALGAQEAGDEADVDALVATKFPDRPDLAEMVAVQVRQRLALWGSTSSEREADA